MITDYREDYVKILRSKFDVHPNIKFYHYDVTNPSNTEIQKPPPDTLICLNVLEHVKPDRQALSHMFDISTSFYFNPVGAMGWFISGRILKAGTIKPWHITFQRYLLPISRLIDKLPIPFGLSLACAGIKPEALP